jgi:Domain of unknown function (DUF4365)
VVAWVSLVDQAPGAFNEAAHAFDEAWTARDVFALTQSAIAALNALMIGNHDQRGALAAFEPRMIQLRGMRPLFSSLPFVETQWFSALLATNSADERSVNQLREVALACAARDPNVRAVLRSLVDGYIRLAIQRATHLVCLLAELLEALCDPSDDIAVLGALAYAVQAAGAGGDPVSLGQLVAQRDARLERLSAEHGSGSVAHVAIHTWATNALAWCSHARNLRDANALSDTLKITLSNAAAEASRALRHFQEHRSSLGAYRRNCELLAGSAHEKVMQEMTLAWDGAVRAEIHALEAARPLPQVRVPREQSPNARHSANAQSAAKSHSVALSTGRRSFQTARESEASFLLLIARLSWRAIPTPLEVDHGIDYRVEIVPADSEPSEHREILVQLKGTRRAFSRRGLTVRVASETAAYWRAKLLPVMICLHHVPSDKFYYRWFDQEVRDGTKSVGITFAASDEFDADAVAAVSSRYYSAFRDVLASPAGLLAYGHVLAAVLICIRHTWATYPLWSARRLAEQRGQQFDSPSPASEIWGVVLIIMTVADLEIVPKPFAPGSSEATELRQLIAELVALRDIWYENPLSTIQGWSFGVYDPPKFVECIPHLIAKLLEIAEFIGLNAIRIPMTDEEPAFDDG